MASFVEFKKRLKRLRTGADGPAEVLAMATDSDPPPQCSTCRQPGIAKGGTNNGYQAWKCAAGHDFMVRVGVLGPPTNSFPLPIRLDLGLGGRSMVCDYRADMVFIVWQGNRPMGQGTFGEKDGKHQVLADGGLPAPIVSEVNRAMQLYFGEVDG